MRVCHNAQIERITLATAICDRGDFLKKGLMKHPPVETIQRKITYLYEHHAHRAMCGRGGQVSVHASSAVAPTKFAPDFGVLTGL